MDKQCSVCLKVLNLINFNKRGKKCKICINESKRTKYNNLDVQGEIKCNTCGVLKEKCCFIKMRKICRDCNNDRRRLKYSNDDVFRTNQIQQSTEFKKQRANMSRIIKENAIKELEKKIGAENTICNYCHSVKEKIRFRKNRKKCKDCENANPINNLKKRIRTRIYLALKTNKELHTVEYLGCKVSEYIEWIIYYGVSFETYGKEWHIDHVIPLSRFDLTDSTQQLIAFNWRNTMPLSVYENLSKNNRIIQQQVITHFIKLQEFHNIKNISIPEEYYELFAKHLDAGSSLEPLLPLTTGNTCEELV